MIQYYNLYTVYYCILYMQLILYFFNIAKSAIYKITLYYILYIFCKKLSGLTFISELT